MSNKINYELIFQSLKYSLFRKNFKTLLNQMGIGNYTGKILGIEHHLSHIGSSFYPSGFDESVCVSIDGFGDFVSTTWGYAKNNEVSTHGKVFFPDSLGIFYQAITQYIGFNNYGDEYKMMGLSPYGKPIYEKQLSKIINYLDEGKFKLNLDYFTHHNDDYAMNFDSNGSPIIKKLYSDKLIELLGPPRTPNNMIESFHKDIACSAQKIYENIFFDIMNFVYNKYNNSNLSLSGGCVMNSVANGKIRQRTKFKNIYIPSSPGDSGGSIGSAYTYLSKSIKVGRKVNHSYFGPKFSNEEIKKEIDKLILNSSDKSNFEVKNFENDNELLDFITENILQNKIVGWFQGKMEFGPRALGNRSIIANPCNLEIRDIINKKIKLREMFRPFAPSILYEDVYNWFEINAELPFMSEVLKIKKNKDKIKAVVHIDDTCRVHTVKECDNKKFYNLIKLFKKKTDIPILLNTSFNENEPIVCSPFDAINCFLRTEMDIICLGNWIIKR